MGFLKGAVMMLQTLLGEYVSVPIFAYSHCQLETDSEEMPAAQSPRTFPGATQPSMSDLLLRLSGD
jgi:hypothetical protein